MLIHVIQGVDTASNNMESAKNLSQYTLEALKSQTGPSHPNIGDKSSSVIYIVDSQVETQERCVTIDRYSFFLGVSKKRQ